MQQASRTLLQIMERLVLCRNYNKATCNDPKYALLKSFLADLATMIEYSHK